jgi:hypothetical protein
VQKNRFMVETVSYSISTQAVPFSKTASFVPCLLA